MANIISIVNQKGGVGKTTTSINLASFLALKGNFVLLVDMDPQCNASSGLGFDIQTLDNDIYKVLINEVNIKEAIRPGPIQGLNILPAGLDLAGATVELVSLEDREFKLYNALQAIRNDYDFIIIDCPPSLGLLTINCLIAAEYVLIPVQAEYYALEGLGQLLKTIYLIQENIKDKLEILGAVITMYDKRNLLSWQVKQELKKHFPFYVFNIVIPRNIRLTESPSYGLPICEYAPKSKGAFAYEKLADEVLNIFKNQQSNF